MPIGLFALVLMGGLAGCHRTPVGQGKIQLGAPVLPLTAPALEQGLAKEIFAGCPAAQANPQSSALLDNLILGYVNAGRDFRPPVGTDGFVLRVIPLDKDSRPRQIQGELFIRLISMAGPSAPARLVRTWHIPAAALPTYWVRTGLLDCYFLRLDWGTDPVPEGRYRFTIALRYTQRHKTHTICEYLTIQN